MPVRSMKEDDPLDDFARREIAFDGVAKRVYVAGQRPAVIVMSEMPGSSPEVARFARWVRDAAFTVLHALAVRPRRRRARRRGRCRGVQTGLR